MAKISTKIDAKASKSKVKKSDYWGPQIEAIYNAYMNCTMLEKRALKEALDDFVTWGSVESFLDDWFNLTADVLDKWEWEGDDEDFEKSKKSMTTAQMIKTLKSMGYTVSKAEDEETEEETEETVEEDEETEDGDVDVDVEVDKGCSQSKNFTRKSRTGKSAKRNGAEMLKSRGWVKAEDKGPDAEEVETEAIGSENAVKVPETPEPSDNVEDVETKVPEADALEDDGVKTEDTGAEEGNDMDALEDEGITTQDIVDMDIDALIEKKRALKAKDQVPPAHTQPFANNYRVTQMGQGKGQVPAGALGKSTRSIGRKA